MLGVDRSAALQYALPTLLPTLLPTVIAAIAISVILHRWLVGTGYRLPDEAHLPRRRLAWFVPTVTVAAGAVAASLLALTASPVAATGYAGFAAVLVVLAAIDLDVHRLPDGIQLPAYPALGVILALASWHTGRWDSLVPAAIAAVLAFGSFLVLALIGSGMGYGDVKLAGLLGPLLGWVAWPLALYGLAAGIVIGGLVGAALLVTRRAARTTEFAYGPSLIAGALLTLAAAPLLR